MRKSSVYVGFFLGFFIFVAGVAIPLDVYAQSRYRYSSSYRSKIEKLDEDEVKNLPIPILFGVTLQMITPNFGDPRDGGTRTHEGEDIMAPEGAPIVSPTEAVVTSTGTGSGSGKYVRTANPGGESFVYMHLSEILVSSGDELDVGDIIGYVGDTGNASGGPAHLHLEIRDGRTATDPFPRLAREFSPKEKMEFLKNAIEEVSDEDELIEFVVKQYPGELLAARSAGITLPSDIEKAFMAIRGTALPRVPVLGDVTLGSEGPLVAAIQSFLILKNTGPAAHALAIATATGYFGPITQRALIEYQVASGIIPADGYFGIETRTHLMTKEVPN